MPELDFEVPARPTPESAREAVHALCDEILFDLFDPDRLEVEVQVEPELIVEVRSPYAPELDHEVLRFFLDLQQHLFVPAGEPLRYCWSWRTPERRYYMECDWSLLPDTAGFTEAHWEEFIDQFVYTIDGEQQILPTPNEFLPEDLDEEEN